MKHRIVAISLVALFAISAGSSLPSSAGSTSPDRDRTPQRDYAKRAPNLRLEAGLIRTGTGNWGTLTNTKKYSIIIASSGNAKFAGAQPGRALTWGCGVNIPRAAWAADCGVSWSDSVAKNWVLKDASGSYVSYPGGGSYLLDVGNKDYQRRFISEMDADIRTHPGVDGVFIDNVVGSLITSSSTYRDSESYRAAMLSFIKAVGPALRAKGWYVAVNASILDGAAERFTGQAYDGTQFIWWVNQIATYVDGISLEHWQQNWDSTGSVRLSGTSGSQAWDGWQRVATAVQRAGKDFYAMEQGPLNDVNKAAYLKASFLLGWRSGQGAFFYTDDYASTTNPWNPAWMLNIGRPAEIKHRVGIGWRRRFTRGVVILNPSSSASQKFTFPRRYLMPDGSATRVVTLEPGRGLLLRLWTVR